MKTAILKENNIKSITKEQCCGCGACYNICPVRAISMQANEEGFLAPVIDEDKCTNCGLCKKACPYINAQFNNNPNPDCYAAMASDDIRMQSSSGGIFTLIANYILDKGGYVCGAAYGNNWNVEHIIIDNKEDLAKLRKSKYIQSNTKEIYIKVKECLENDKYVLFSGCPCQVAGLKTYLDKDYKNLLTIDLVCHGVPSPMVFRKFIQENYSESEITSIDFREKEVLGWTTPTVIKYKNGAVYRKAYNECPYFRGFLANLFLNIPCGDCKFNKIPRQGDITLGDFWLISQYNKKYTDGKGTGIVLINDEKGNFYIKEIKKSLKLFKKVPLKFALKSNPNLNCSFNHNKNRERFFRYLKTNSYKDAFKYAVGEKYDIGLMGLGFANNYGAALTNFGLVKVLEKIGKSVLVIDKPEEYKTNPDMNITRKFNFKHFNMSKQYNKRNIIQLNNICDTFIVGSDQVWHWNVLKSFREYYLLEFVSEEKRKIAYASSFGHYNFIVPEPHKRIFSYLLSRFDAISVREISGINICKEMGIEAKNVLDPVFLCDPKEYIKLAKSVPSKYPPEKYIFTYILDAHHSDKRSALIKLSNYLKLPLINITDYNNQSKQEKILKLKIEKNIEIEDFISLIYNSQFVITDSFHGVCFAIIFKKNFLCIVNKRRGIARFESLLYRLNLQDRMIYNPEDLNEKKDILNKNIDYDTVYRILEKEKIYSLKFLKDSLNITKKPKANSEFDGLTNIIKDCWIKELRTRLDQNNTNCNLILNSRKIFRKYYRYKILSKILLGKKREHYKYKAQIWHEKVRQIRRLDNEFTIA